jgi:hypothetical protein
MDDYDKGNSHDHTDADPPTGGGSDERRTPRDLRVLAREGKGSKAPLTESFLRYPNNKYVVLALLGATAGQGVVWYTGQFYALFFLTITHLDVAALSHRQWLVRRNAAAARDRGGGDDRRPVCRALVPGVAVMTLLVGLAFLGDTKDVTSPPVRASKRKPSPDALSTTNARGGRIGRPLFLSCRGKEATQFFCSSFRNFLGKEMTGIKARHGDRLPEPGISPAGRR